MRNRSRCAALAAIATVVALPRFARATDCSPASGISTCIDSDNLWLHAGASTFAAIGGVTTTPAGQASFGMLSSYFSHPIGLRVGSADPKGTVVHAVDDVLDATFGWTLGLTNRVEVSAAVPVALYQSGSGLADVRGGNETLDRSAMRDARVGLAGAILPRPRTGQQRGTAVTGRFEVVAPTGDTSSFSGTGAFAAVPSVVADHRMDRFEFAVELGARFRAGRDFAGSRIGSQVAYGAAAAFDVIPTRQWLTLTAEMVGLYTLEQTLERGPSAGQASTTVAPAEWLFSARSSPFLAGDVSFVAAGGSALPLTSEPSVTSPRFRFDLGLRYAPLGLDLDGDGVLDRDDQCLASPEDRDGFEDSDGCPDPDNDGDRIADAKDQCRDVPEDFDGFQDEDGCPDPDDDLDGIPDAQDQCRNAAEDRDGFRDEDGCPDPDNDGDGIPDGQDACPNQAEDIDGFQDQNGCPDPDDDNDGIVDQRDRCPREAEDVDGFEDEDGCPDPDDDADGIPDAKDACPRAAETINGVADDDGCPEAGGRTTLSWTGDRITFETAHRFAPGQAILTAALQADIAMAASFAKTRGDGTTILIEAYADQAGDESPQATALAGRRADAARAKLLELGLPAERINAAAGDPGEKQGRDVHALVFTVTRHVPVRNKR